ncbi:MAG TPA: ABC transporter ATP-binding protein [Geminicoccus sp.]|jgi:ABC-type glutathione transport system ATPase component|uniref:ABC transporter ATP-binding protein n=1 Tax=Geminicoccus sp. TaxID=2024832 RepID=UPI002E310318|nr:ABC transporter ATP-binding protein [Geminicoccus sp.]HEX2528074.1 ABC transporter ATP-binding protein [Geminicoccus sp.]
MTLPVLQLQDVSIAYRTRAGESMAVDGVNLSIAPGESVGLVGESGSGKSTIAFAVMRYLPKNGRLARGRILFEGRDLYAMSDAEIRSLRGGKMAMVYQEPMSSLNPVIPIERQLMEVAQLHLGMDEAAARAKAIEAFATVKLPEPDTIGVRYPHQISGGQQQRVVIAMALMGNPSLLILDEPTTALDVRVQAGILELLAELRRKLGLAMLFISHDLGTIATVCDRVGVMLRGRMVEEGPCRQVFVTPQHEYTQRLIGSIPKLSDPIVEREVPAGPPAVVVTDLSKAYMQGGGLAFATGGGTKVQALTDVTFAASRGRTLAIVGESGSGKSTFAKIMLGIETTPDGQVSLADGYVLSTASVTARPKEVLARLQMVFQNPDATLNPSHTVGFAIGRPLKLLKKAKGDVKEEVRRLLAAVRLPAAFAERYPYQLSGGQKQRIAIARAIASEPDIVIADEPTASLDVSVQARVVELLRDIQRDRELTLVFISHDLALVRSFADDVAVIYQGRVVDYGPVAKVFSPPHHPYTAELIAAVPQVPVAA